MSRSRGSFLVTLAFALAGVVSAIVAPAGRAMASTDFLNIMSAGSPVTNVGELTVVTYTMVPVTAVTAHLMTEGASPVDTLDPALTETATSSASPYIYETWSVPAPITTGQLPLGSYSIDVDVTFQDQTTATADSVGTLNFLNEPQITLTADHTKVGYDYTPTVNLSGSVTILAPDGTQTPYANSPVTLTSTFAADPTTVTTDGSGNFTGQVSTQTGGSVVASAGGTGDLGYMGTIVNLTQVVDPLKLSAHLSLATIRYGGKDTLTGTLSYLPNDTGTAYKPLAGRVVQVTSSENPGVVAATAKTNTTGGFSIGLPTAGLTTSTWTVTAGSKAGDHLFGPAQVALLMKVQEATRVTKFHVTLNQFWGLNFSGCLNLPYRMGAPIQNTKGLEFQYSSSPNGPWRTLVKQVPESGVCGTQGLWFNWSAVAQQNYAYYRVYYAGYTDPYSGVIYLPSSSAKLLAWKYADRIAGLRVSPRVLSAGQNLTVKGQLQYYHYTWHNYANQLIYIVFRAKGTTAWYWVVRVRTNSAGRFSATFHDNYGSATWSAVFEGNSTHLAASPVGSYVRVRGSAIGAVRDSRAPNLHATVTFPMIISGLQPAVIR